MTTANVTTSNTSVPVTRPAGSERPEDVADAVLFAMTNTFLTGVTLKIDGGEPLT